MPWLSRIRGALTLAPGDSTRSSLIVNSQLSPKSYNSFIDSPGCGGSSPSRIRGACGDARKGVPYRDRSLGEEDQAADRNSRLRILVRSSTRFILGISSRSIAV